MTSKNRVAAALGSVLAPFAAAVAAAAPIEVAPVPHVQALPETARSHAFSAALHQARPFDLREVGYIEEEYLVSGTARVFDWGADALQVLAQGPCTTRILVRRPKHGARASGTVIVEPLNPSVDIDLPIMWAESYEHFIAAGDAWDFPVRYVFDGA